MIQFHFKGFSFLDKRHHLVFKLSLKEGLQGNALLLHGVTGILRDSRKEETQLGWRLSSHSERQHSEVGGEQLLPSDSDHILVRGRGGWCLSVNLEQ